MAWNSLPLEAKLLNIRDYSDFTLVCRGRRFRLHKAIVCAQSSVIATSLREGLIDVSRDRATLVSDPSLRTCLTTATAG
jgi:hypothetical protein